jgi:hypothetical protein
MRYKARALSPVTVSTWFISPNRGCVVHNTKAPTTFGPAYTWDLGKLPPVMMDVQNTVNYQLNGSYADKQWDQLVPGHSRDKGNIRLGSDRKYMLSMFHQLQCLDITRRAYVDGAEGRDSVRSSLTRHCLNYIRQMVMCRAESKLERVIDPDGAHAVQVREPQKCLNWRVVYGRVEKKSEPSWWGVS